LGERYCNGNGNANQQLPEKEKGWNKAQREQVAEREGDLAQQSGCKGHACEQGEADQSSPDVKEDDRGRGREGRAPQEVGKAIENGQTIEIGQGPAKQKAGPREQVDTVGAPAKEIDNEHSSEGEEAEVAREPSGSLAGCKGK